jgi:molybdopterin-guanine dinucleotide biosynthesis protein A
MTGIILAGGESSRMGSDKAFLQFGGTSLIERVLNVFLAQFDQTIIVTNAPERYAGFRVRVYKDALDVKGPLTGIYTGLLHSRTDHCFVTACDMPFLNPRLITYMADVAGDFDAVVPLVNGYPEPLHAIYHRRTLPLIQDSLSKGDGKISRLYEKVRVRYLSDDEIAYYDPERQSFKNLNTPAEYKEALCSDSECRSY